MDGEEVSTGRAEAFVAVEGAVQEDVPGGPLLLAAYGSLWILLMLYVVRLLRLQERLSAEARELRELLPR